MGVRRDDWIIGPFGSDNGDAGYDPKRLSRTTPQSARIGDRVI
jgi:hypothetical protein